MAEVKVSKVIVGDDKMSDSFIQAVSTLLDMNLKSLLVECPSCKSEGLAMTKWIKGRNTKPLFVFHKNNGGSLTECFIDEKNAKGIRGNVDLSKKDMKRLFRKTKTYVMFSGGIDSLCTLLYLMNTLKPNNGNLTALHIDTTAGFPEVTRYVKRACKKLNIPLKIVKPKRDYFELAKRWGIPSFNARWCCKELKINPVRDFISKIEGPKIVIDGIRAAESYLRNTYLPVWYHPAFQCLSISPILGWSNKEVKAYVEASGQEEGPAKELGCSAECWCGAYKKRADFEKLLEVHPDIFDKLLEVEKAQKGRFTFIYEDGKQIPLQSLQKIKK